MAKLVGIDLKIKVALHSLARRVQHEEGALGQMLARGNHKGLSYQSGLRDGLVIAQQIMAGLETAVDAQPAADSVVDAA